MPIYNTEEETMWRTVEGAAEHFGVSKPTIYRWIKKNKIRATVSMCTGRGYIVDINSMGTESTTKKNTEPKYTIDPKVSARLIDAAYFGVLDDVLDLLKDSTTLEEIDRVVEEAADKMARALGCDDYEEESEELITPIIPHIP